MMRRALRAIKQPGAAHFFLQCEENDKKGGIAVNKKQLMIELAMPIVFMLGNHSSGKSTFINYITGQ